MTQPISRIGQSFFVQAYETIKKPRNAAICLLAFAALAALALRVPRRCAAYLFSKSLQPTPVQHHKTFTTCADTAARGSSHNDAKDAQEKRDAKAMESLRALSSNAPSKESDKPNDVVGQTAARDSSHNDAQTPQEKRHDKAVEDLRAFSSSAPPHPDGVVFETEYRTSVHGNLI